MWNIYIYIKPNFQEPAGVRIAKALNDLLSKESIKKYDYLLRVDADVILPLSFLETNLKLDADYVGRAGYAMLLRVSAFIKFFGGRFPEIPAEDSYVGLKLIACGAGVKPYAIPPILKEKNDVAWWRKLIVRGKEAYKLGYEPLHILWLVLHDIKKIFILIGYFIALFMRLRRYDIYGFVFRAQLKRLLGVR